jgi:tetratricopeptide (TPR) repeat protein
MPRLYPFMKSSRPLAYPPKRCMRDWWRARIRQNKESDPLRLSYLAATALGMGLNDIAAQQYRKVLLIRADDRPARLGLARALARAGLYEEAVKEYRTLLGENK